MALYSLNELKTALNGGARADKFTIQFGVPAGDGSLTLGTEGPILCKATSFPAKTIATIEVWEQGRKLKLPGDTTFDEEWTIQFYQTADHKLRKMFIDWMSKIDNFHTNNHTCTPADFMVEAKVQQLGCDGKVTAEYTFYNMFPSTVTAVEVDGENINTVEIFSVNFNYSDWEITSK